MRPTPSFPVSLDLTGRVVVVVGGGPVGRRKAAAAAAAGARVRVVARESRPDDLPSVIEWITGDYTASHLDGAGLIFAAAGPAVNAFVVADATARGAWVNDAADPARGTFTLPATAAAGGLTVAVDTGGAAPALARRVRDRLAAALDPAVADWVAVLADLRAEVLATVPDAAARRRLLADFADWPWLDQLKRDGPDATRAAMRAAVRREDGGETGQPQAPARRG